MCKLYMCSYVLEHQGWCYSKGEGIVIPLSFDPDALNIHGTYVVNNHGEELKAKAPPSIGYVMFRIEIVTDGISGHAAYILNCGIM